MELHSEVKKKKFFSDEAQTGTAWLIVKWRDSWGWGFRTDRREEGGRLEKNFKKAPEKQDAITYHKTDFYMITKRVGREEREEASTLQDVSWRNVPVSSLRINSGAIWKTYLAPTCFSWQKRGKEKNWTESYFMGFSLSPVGSYNTAATLSPRSKADTHPLSAGSTDCHSSCQSTAIYLDAWGLLERGKSRGWREMMMKGARRGTG